MPLSTLLHLRKKPNIFYLTRIIMIPCFDRTWCRILKLSFYTLLCPLCLFNLLLITLVPTRYMPCCLICVKCFLDSSPIIKSRDMNIHWKLLKRMQNFWIGSKNLVTGFRVLLFWVQEAHQFFFRYPLTQWTLIPICGVFGVTCVILIMQFTSFYSRHFM